MKKTALFTLVTLLFLSFIFVGCSDLESSNTSSTPRITMLKSSSDYTGMDYITVQEELSSLGFTSITLKEIDVDSDSSVTSGAVSSVEILSWFFYSSFKEGDSFSETTPITISYYVKEEPPVYLTSENCEDLKILLSLKDPSSPSVQNFVKEYNGRVIEFDGCVLSLMTHGSYKTRYDVLIGSGDYNKNSSKGPNFRFTDVNGTDLSLGTAFLTDVLSVGTNIHIIAQIKSYDPNTSFLELDAVKVSVR